MNMVNTRSRNEHAKRLLFHALLYIHLWAKNLEGIIITIFVQLCFIWKPKCNESFLNKDYQHGFPPFLASYSLLCVFGWPASAQSLPRCPTGRPQMHHNCIGFGFCLKLWSGVAVGEPFLGVQTGEEVEEAYCPRQRLISGIRFRMRPQNTMKRPDTTNGIT